ncbi:MAG: hypothetical protein ACE5MB_01145 [Anaerolineae bacterium]
MARALPGASYFAILSVLDTDIERLNKEGLRRYLQRRLRHLETRIYLLSQQCYAAAGPNWGSRPWDQEAEEIWENILELDYLEAVREAVAEALAAL